MNYSELKLYLPDIEENLFGLVLDNTLPPIHHFSSARNSAKTSLVQSSKFPFVGSACS